MAGRHSAKGIKNSGNSKVRRRGLVVVGGSVGAFAAAAAMATGSAAPAKADMIDTLLDPIIQPLVTSVADAIAGFDPAAGTDLTSWTDSLLSSLNSIDLGLPSTADPAASAASAAPAESDPTTGTYEIPITVQEDTEPTVQATVDGSDETLLVDTGSSGLVIPWDSLGTDGDPSELGSNDLTSFLDLLSLGVPSSIGESGYSGGVDYIYLVYNNVPTDYLGGTGLDTSGPVDLEIFSWPTSSDSPSSFDAFLQDDDSTGILGIGDSSSAGGPTESPLEEEGYDGVTVDLPQDELIVSPSNPFTAISGGTFDGAPNVDNSLTETVTSSTGAPVGTGSVSDDVDSGGVYGTIPSSIDSGTLAQGDNVTVYNDGTELYSYVVGTDSDDTDEAPIVTSGTSIDSGVEPFEEEPIYIDYTGGSGDDGSITFDEPLV